MSRDRIACHLHNCQLASRTTRHQRQHDMAGDIRELPQDTRDTLRSTFIIQTLPSCIVELVQNALDAQATAIEVAVSVANWECRVTDNGHGIDVRSLGLLGRRYRRYRDKAIFCGRE